MFDSQVIINIPPIADDRGNLSPGELDSTSGAATATQVNKASSRFAQKHSEHIDLQYSWITFTFTREENYCCPAVSVIPERVASEVYCVPRTASENLPNSRNGNRIFTQTANATYKNSLVF